LAPHKNETLDVVTSQKKKKGTGDVHKNLLNDWVLHKNWWSDSHNILGDIYLWIQNNKATYNATMHLWVSRRSTQARL